MNKDEATGKRWVQVETEVPGTPEEVWDAIATGPGVSSWFVPTKFEDGKVISQFAPGMDGVADITAWDPPRSFSAISENMGPGAPPMATEWTVEAKAGGTCIVRVVHSLFASNDDWDGQLTGTESGWPSIFRVLRLYLTRFKGQPVASFQAMAMMPVKSAAEAWPRFTDTLSLPSEAGAPWTAPAGAPPLTGRVEWTEPEKHTQLVSLEGPVSGMLMLMACGAGDQTMLFLGFFLFGNGAKEPAAHAEPAWQAWLEERFA
jgi:hypothetical protein